MLPNRLSGILTILILLTAGWTEPVAARQTPARAELHLRPGDELLVIVKDEPSLTGRFGVADDGSVMLPLLGRVQVAGRSFGEVESELLRGYERELAEPVVQISPMIRIAVLGHVQRPGLYPVDLSHSVADVLALAGGVSPIGDPRRISLVRGAEVIQTRLDPGSPVLAGSVQSGDQIVVGRRSWFQENMPVLVGAAASVAAAAITSLIVR